ncbi:MAG: AMP-binding protein, partial [Burkholderiales bacterium]|nr:AMP-binding protein [Burkholderiales bacterium]
MDKIWLQQYPPGIPAEIDASEFASLKDILEQSCARFGALPAYGNMGVSITYAELDQASRAFGAFLQKSLGMRRGERVALMLPNLLQYPVALFGALRAGLTVVNVNPQYTERELEHQLKDAGATAIVVLENFAHTLAAVLPRTPVRTVVATQVGDLFPWPKRSVVNFVVKHVKKMVPPWRIPDAVGFGAALAAGRAQVLDDVQLGHDDIAFLQYTGGTTGVAKGAVLTHGNMVANLQQVTAWIGRDLKDGEETAILPLPLYHVYALTSNLVFMKIGARAILITNPRDMPAFIKELGRQQFTAMIAVNTLYNALLSAPGFAGVATRQ